MHYPARLQRSLVIDELFDLMLYKMLLAHADGQTAKTLTHLVAVETRHVAIWQNFFQLPIDRLPFLKRMKLSLLSGVCRLFGPRAIHLILEGIEVYGIKKYLHIWEHYKEDPAMREALEEILREEFEHEDEIVSGLIKQQIYPERIRNFFLGFNDGLVEITGAVGGFFAAFGQFPSILIASTTVAIAGALSMAAGAFIATESEHEVQQLEREKMNFLGQPAEKVPRESALSSGVFVGAAYLLGAVIPILPIFFGAQSVWYSLMAGILVISAISYVLAFLSGMAIRRRVLMNVTLMIAAVGITYLIGGAVKQIWGIDV